MNGNFLSVEATQWSFGDMTSTSITFSTRTDADSPRASVTIHPDGKVTYTGTLDEATETFWKAVEASGYRRYKDAV